MIGIGGDEEARAEIGAPPRGGNVVIIRIKEKLLAVKKENVVE